MINTTPKIVATVSTTPTALEIRGAALALEFAPGLAVQVGEGESALLVVDAGEEQEGGRFALMGLEECEDGADTQDAESYATAEAAILAAAQNAESEEPDVGDTEVHDAAGIED